MNYDLDLRSPAYVNRDLYNKKRHLFNALFIILILSPFFIYYGLNHYHQLLTNQVALLENEVLMLRLETEPLLAITTELENMKMRKHLIDQQNKDRNKWSSGLYLLHDTTPEQITITRIEFAPGGLIKIDGFSTKMYSPARYRQKLAGLSDFELTELNVMNLNADQNYTFNITTQLSLGDEPDDKTEEMVTR